MASKLSITDREVKSLWSIGLTKRLDLQSLRSRLLNFRSSLPMEISILCSTVMWPHTNTEISLKNLLQQTTTTLIIAYKELNQLQEQYKSSDHLAQLLAPKLIATSRAGSQTMKDQLYSPSMIELLAISLDKEVLE